jgi:NADH-quinone oxidoreductase subunit F
MSNGSIRVREALETAIKEASLEKEIEIIVTGCMGICELGPIMVVYPDGVFYQQLQPEDAREICSRTPFEG